MLALTPASPAPSTLRPLSSSLTRPFQVRSDTNVGGGGAEWCTVAAAAEATRDKPACSCATSRFNKDNSVPARTSRSCRSFATCNACCCDHIYIYIYVCIYLLTHTYIYIYAAVLPRATRAVATQCSVSCPHERRGESKWTHELNNTTRAALTHELMRMQCSRPAAAGPLHL